MIRTGFIYLFLVALTVSCATMTPRFEKSLRISEPSDIAYSRSDDSLYIVSDNGHIYQTDKNGRILRKADYSQGDDFEGICVNQSSLFVVNESLRRVYEFDKESLTMIRMIPLEYSGGRNRGFESITYNPEKEIYILITEKDPLLIYELDKDFIFRKVVEPAGLTEISSACWYDGFLWVLSDEERTVYQLRDKDYSIIKKWVIDVPNPEGIALDDETIYILSDDFGRLYSYNLPGQGEK